MPKSKDWKLHHHLARNYWAKSLLLLILICSDSSRAAEGAHNPDYLGQTCQALGTVGFHDYGGAPTSFEPTVFNESSFQLEENVLLTEHLAASAGKGSVTFLTLVQGKDRVELECKPVRLKRNAQGVSCINQPPTTLVLLNPHNKRYTRSNLAAWTFSTEQNTAEATLPTGHGGESMFIEHGTCSSN